MHVEGNTSESRISFTAIDENMTLASSSRADIIGNVLPLSLEATTITSTGAVGVNISESVVNFTAIDEHMVLVSTTMQISDKGLPLSSEGINITSTGAVGVNISESVVNFTVIDENMALASNTVQDSDNVVSLLSEDTHITSTGVVGGDTSESVTTVSVTDVNMALVSNTVQDSGNILSLSSEDTNIISTSVIVEDISETTFVAVPFIDNDKLVDNNIRTVPSNVNLVTLLNTGHVTTNLQDFHVSGESVRDLDRKRYDAESFDVSTFSDNIVAASLVYRDSMFITELQTPILQPSSVWQHPRGDIHFKTGITEPYSLGMYFIYF
jgi:hypothetical protein